VGSLGRVPEVPADAVTSPEYQVWSIKDPNWLPDYVEILIKMPFFNLLVQVHRVGAVKQRLYTRNLAEIPVPPVNKSFQSALVAKWKAFQSKLAESEAFIASHEEALVAEVLTTAGIRIDMPPKRPKAYAVLLDEVDRWGVGFNRHRWKLDDLLRSTLFPCTPLSSVAYVNPGRTKTIEPGTRVSFVPMEAVSEVSGSIDVHEDDLVENVSKGYTVFEEGDVIWAKITPCMQNGKSAVARNLQNGVGFGSTEFHVVRPMDPKQTLPEYLWVLLRLRAVRMAAMRYFTGSAGQQRVPSSFLESLAIPLPPTDVQQTIVDGVLSKRQVVQKERQDIAERREKFIVEIDQNIISGILT
jgi:type I restriction enzyme, S subunit